MISLEIYSSFYFTVLMDYLWLPGFLAGVFLGNVPHMKNIEYRYIEYRNINTVK